MPTCSQFPCVLIPRGSDSERVPIGPRSHFDFAHVDFDAVAPALGVFFGVPSSGLVILRGGLTIVAFGEDMDDAGCFH